MLLEITVENTSSKEGNVLSVLIIEALTYYLSLIMSILTTGIVIIRETGDGTGLFLINPVIHASQQIFT